MSDLYDRTPVLRELLVDKTAITPGGECGPAHSTVLEKYVEALHRTILKEKPDVVLEVGMAQGASTLAILTALEQLGGDGRLLSIDPNQSTVFESQGLHNVKRAGLQDRHELIEEPDYTALPRMLQDGLKLDFAYIDGWHTFDYTLLDFWYTDRMLRVNGVVALNDCGWRAVSKAIGFVMTHRKYGEMDVGLRRSIVPGRELIRFLKLQFGAQFRRMNQDRYFRKQEDWEPSFHFFRDF